MQITPGKLQGVGKMKKVCFLLAVVVLVSCATTKQGIYSTYDELTETSLIRCKLKMPFDPHRQGLFDTNIITFYKSPKAYSGSITMSFSLITSSWHFIDSMILKIDGAIQQLDPYDIDHDVLIDGSIAETIAWKLPFETVKRIGYSQRTQVRFISSKGRNLDFEFDTEQKDLISEFLDY